VFSKCNLSDGHDTGHPRLIRTGERKPGAPDRRVGIWLADFTTLIQLSRIPRASGRSRPQVTFRDLALARRASRLTGIEATSFVSKVPPTPSSTARGLVCGREAPPTRSRWPEAPRQRGAVILPSTAEGGCLGGTDGLGVAVSGSPAPCNKSGR
jgi:hypothetical protein